MKARLSAYLDAIAGDEGGVLGGRKPEARWRDRLAFLFLRGEREVEVEEEGKRIGGGGQAIPPKAQFYRSNA